MATMSYVSKIGFNIFLLVLFCGFLVFFMMKNDYYLTDSNSIKSLLVNTNLSKPKTPMTVSVLLKDIMRAPVSLRQDDPVLIDTIRKKYLVPPSTLPYYLTGNTDDPSKGQSDEIKKILSEKRDGFFIECGALDGETRSNSLVFEKRYGWKGVLIEGDPANFQLVLQKNRKAWAVPACLSTLAYPNMVLFKQQFNVGKISGIPLNSEQKKGSRLAEVQCLPIYSIMLALNKTSVDYFSLDVEGNELEVLQTIPWDKVNITALSVEFIHGKAGKQKLKEYMESKGYKTFSEVTFPGSLANDFIFYHLVLLGKSL